jgi:hypothetical protein
MACFIVTLFICLFDFSRLRTQSVVQATHKGKFCVGQTVVPEHNLQKNRAKKRKEEKSQEIYDSILKQQDSISRRKDQVIVF